MLHNKKVIFLILLALAIIISAGLVLNVALKHANFTKNFVDSNLNTASFHTLKPSNNQNIKLQPLKADQAFAFDDQLNGTAITISQQPLPKDFNSNPDQSVANLAQKYNATTKIAAGDTTAYTGHAVSGNQTTIFTKNGVLVFITSKKTILDSDLADYIKSLR